MTQFFDHSARTVVAVTSAVDLRGAGPLSQFTDGMLVFEQAIETFYSWSSTSVAADDGVNVIKPTAVGGGAGRWLIVPNTSSVTTVFGRSGNVVAQAGDYTAAQVGAVPTTRNVNVSGLVSGGGALSADITITVAPGLVGDIQPLAASASAGGLAKAARADHQHPFPTAAQVGAVGPTRNIFTAGLATGGGDLSADRTINVTAGANADIQPLNATAVGGTSGKAADAGHQHPFPTAAQVGAVPTTRTITAAGLATGGGDLSANRTITVTAGLVGDIQPLAASAVAGATGKAADAGHQHPFPTVANILGSGTYAGELIVWSGSAWTKVSAGTVFPKVVNNGIAAAYTAGLNMTNSTAATSGVPMQSSPALQLTGTYWDGSVSRSADWYVANRRYAANLFTELAFSVNNVQTTGIEQALSLRHATSLTLLELFSGTSGSVMLWGAQGTGPGFIQGAEAGVLNPEQVLNIQGTRWAWFGAGGNAQVQAYVTGELDLRGQNLQQVNIFTDSQIYPAVGANVEIDGAFVDQSGTHINGGQIIVEGGQGSGVGDRGGSVHINAGKGGIAGAGGGSVVLNAGKPGAGGTDGLAIMADANFLPRVQVNATGVGFNNTAPIAAPNYTTTSVTTTRTINPTTATLSDVANVLGTVVNDLISYGLFT